MAYHADVPSGTQGARITGRNPVHEDRNRNTVQLCKKKGLKAPENLGETVALIGRLGGYLGRRNDPPPGHLSLCKGHHTLRILCEGILLATQVEANNNESYV